MKQSGKPARTSELLRMLFKEKKLDNFYEKNGESFNLPTFHEYITALCKERGEVAEKIIERSDMEKSFGHKLFVGTRNPSRDSVIRLAFGFGADLELAQDMLKIAGKSPLYPRVKRDAAIIHCLHNGVSVVETQIILSDLKLPLLGDGNRNE